MSAQDFHMELIEDGLVWLELPAHKPFDHHAFLVALRRYEQHVTKVNPGKNPILIGVLAHYAPTDESMMQLFLQSGWYMNRFEALALVGSSDIAMTQLRRFVDITNFRTPTQLLDNQEAAISWLQGPKEHVPTVLDNGIINPDDNDLILEENAFPEVALTPDMMIRPQ